MDCDDRAGRGDNNSQGHILATFEPTICGFCSTDLKIGEGVVLDGCLHNFCKDCVVAVIEGSTTPQVQCPLHEETGCGGVMLDTEVEAVVSPFSFQNYLNRSILPVDESGGGCSGTDPMKKAKIEIDPDVAKDWEAKWKQLTAFVPKLVPVNGAGGGGGGQRGFWGSAAPEFGSNNRNSLLALSMEMQETHLLVAQEEFDCPICFCPVPKGQGVILKDCFHSFCRACLTEVIQLSEGSTVPCPHRINEDLCSSCISDREIKHLVSSQFYETFLRRSVTQAELGMSDKTYHCKTADCDFFWELANPTPEMEGELICPACSKKNCLKCKAVHETKTCADYQTQLQQDEMDIKTKSLLQSKVNKGLVMKCPTCKLMIEKNGGCSHMHCTVCRTDFTWTRSHPTTGRGQGQPRAALAIPLGIPWRNQRLEHVPAMNQAPIGRAEQNRRPDRLRGRVQHGRVEAPGRRRAQGRHRARPQRQARPARRQRRNPFRDNDGRRRR